MSQREPGAVEQPKAARAAAVKVVAAWIALPLSLLSTGGSSAWWEAWVYCAVVLVPMTIFVAYVTKRDPEFIARRTRLREKERTQRRVVGWGAPVLLAAWVIPGLDHRFGWSHPPAAAVIAALAVTLGAYLVILRVFVENRWAGAPLRLTRTSKSSQQDRTPSCGTRCTRARRSCSWRRRSRSDRGGP